MRIRKLRRNIKRFLKFYNFIIIFLKLLLKSKKNSKSLIEERPISLKIFI
jgi:hypothetical protein